MDYSLSEENYLKAIYHLSNGGEQEVSTNALADHLNTKPASVSDMIKKLARKSVIDYEPYQGVNITRSGKKVALYIIRKHRLWEVFLVNKLDFQWDQVHEVAEQLEHIKSKLLITRLDEYLGFPKVDPHGDPIPNDAGEITNYPQTPLSEIPVGIEGVVTGVDDSDPDFLQHLDKIGISLGSNLKIIERSSFDQSVEITINQKQNQFLSREASNNILITI